MQGCVYKEEESYGHEIIKKKGKEKRESKRLLKEKEKD